MNETERIVRMVRRRLRNVRFLARLQDNAALAFGLVAAWAGYAWVTGRLADTPRNLLVGAAATVVASLVGTLLKPVRVERAASEADRVLGTRERFSTSLAIHSGRAEDPLGFLPALDRDAADAARTCPTGLVRQGIRPRWRRSTWLAGIFVLAAVLVPLLPLPGGTAVAEETKEVKKERERVAEQARRLERKARRMEQLAAKERKEELRKLAEKIRTAAARLAGDKPRTAKAMAELAKLERDARQATRKFAGMKAPRVGESPAGQDRELAELAEALEKLEKADPAETRRRLDRLLDKIREEGPDAVDKEELQAAIDAVKGLRDAAASLESLGMEGSEIDRFLEGLGGSENLAKLADAMEKLREAMEKAGLDADGGMSEEELKKLAEQMRDYRLPEMSEEDIEKMIAAAEELRRMIEAGEEIRFCKGCMGSGMGIGLGGYGIGLGGSGPGISPGSGGFQRGSSEGPQGQGTGGAGKGRGGRPGVRESDRPVAPDQAPGMVNPEGTAQLIRTVRRIPDPDSEAQEYEELSRAARSEAEEAIKRGEIPRQYRGYIRRYFDDSEGK